MVRWWDERRNDREGDWWPAKEMASEDYLPVDIIKLGPLLTRTEVTTPTSSIFLYFSLCVLSRAFFRGLGTRIAIHWLPLKMIYS